MHVVQRFFRLLLLGLLPLALTSCHLLDKPPAPRRAPVTLSPEQLGEYITHLSLAELALNNGTPDLATATPSLEAIESFTARKSAKKSSDHEVVVIECKGKKKLTLLAPTGSSKTQRNGFQAVADAAKLARCEITNLWPGTLDITPGPALKFQMLAAEASRLQVHERLKTTLSKAKRYGVKDEVLAYIRLTRSFMSINARAGAYIALDNAKYAVAHAESAQVEAEFIKQSLQTLENLEREIRQTM